MTTQEPDLRALAQQNRELSKALASARERIKELSNHLESLSKPPNTFATFVSAQTSQHTATVLQAGKQLDVTAAAWVSLAVVKPGQEVLLNERQVIIGVGTYPKVGQAVAVENIVDPDRILITAVGGKPGLFAWPGASKNKASG